MNPFSNRRKGGAFGILCVVSLLVHVQIAYAFSFPQWSFLSNVYCTATTLFGGSCDDSEVAQDINEINGGEENTLLQDGKKVLGTEVDVFDSMQEIEALKREVDALKELVQNNSTAPICSSDQHVSYYEIEGLVRSVSTLADIQRSVQNKVYAENIPTSTGVSKDELNVLREQIQSLRTGAMYGSSALGVTRAIIGGSMYVNGENVELAPFSGVLNAGSIAVSGTDTSTFVGGLSVGGGASFGGAISTLHNGIFAGSLSVGGDFTVGTSTFFVNATTGRVGVGTTTSEETFDIMGSLGVGQSIYLRNHTPLSALDRLYNNGGNLYWGGVPVMATPTPVLWTESGSDIYRVTGNVGIGTTTPRAMLSLAGGSVLHTPDTSSYQEVGSTTILTGATGSTELSHLTIEGRYGYLYVSDSSITPSVYVYDFLDPERPVRVGSVTVSGAVYPLALASYGDYVYLASQSGIGVKIINVENKKNPRLVSTFALGSQISDLKAHQGFLYAEDVSTRKLYVVDVRQPESPKLASQLSLGATSNWGFDISGGYLYVLEYGWLDVVDISNPYSPRWRGWVGTGSANQIKVSGDMAYLISGSNDRLQIVDVSDPDAPALKSQLTLGSNPFDFEVEGDYAYVLDSSNKKVSVVNVSSSTAPRLVRDISMSSYSITSIDVEGPYIYVAETTNYLMRVLSIPSIKTPALVSSSLQTGDVYIKKHLTVYGNTYLETLLLGRGGLMSTGRGTFSVDQPAGDTVPPALTVIARDGRSNSVTDVLELAHFSTSTPSSGISTGIVFKTDLDSGEGTTTARIVSITTDVSAGTPAGALAFHLKSGTGSVTERMRITATGYVGIGTSTPSAQLTTTGSVRFATFGAGSLQTDANGNLLVSSDERLKDINTTYSRGLDAIMGLSPIIYHWKSETGFDTKNAYTGFSAQNVQEYIPEAVGESKDGFLTFSDRPIIATIVNAIKELNTKVDRLSSGVVSQLGSVISVERANVQEVCWDDVCVTKEQMRQLLESNGMVQNTPPQAQQEVVVEDEYVSDEEVVADVDESNSGELLDDGTENDTVSDIPEYTENNVGDIVSEGTIE